MVVNENSEQSPTAEWFWMLPYVVAIALALLLTGILGSFAVFHSTFLPGTRLRAGDLAGFLGYGGALLLFWFLGKRMAFQVERYPATLAFLRPMVMPLVMLIVLSLSYDVVLLVAKPFLDRSAQVVYNWIFMIGLMAIAVWLMMAWLRHAAPLLESARRPATPHPEISCPRCNALLVNYGKYCGECGARLPRSPA